MQEISVRTRQREEVVDITAQVEAVVKQSGIGEGVCFVFVPHTTAAVTINENADPTVCADILEQLRRIVPQHLPHYRHSEGNSDAHIKSVLVGCQTAIPVSEGRLQLGTWQGLFFCEFDGPRSRKVWVAVAPAK